ncbi:MAG: AAA family ATPase [Actinobacteria bacterium]|nr:AAA family ATPase [Actinomycetota bacterium]
MRAVEIEADTRTAEVRDLIYLHFGGYDGWVAMTKAPGSRISRSALTWVRYPHEVSKMAQWILHQEEKQSQIRMTPHPMSERRQDWGRIRLYSWADGKLEEVTSIEGGFDLVDHGFYRKVERPSPTRLSDLLDRKPGDPPFETRLARQEAKAALERLRIHEWAREQIRLEREAKEIAFPETTFTLADELAMDEPPLAFTIAGLHPQGSNSLLTAAFKTGKSTLSLNILKALVDGEPFLDAFEVELHGRVGYWNFEVTGEMFREWARRMDIRHADRAVVAHFRGFRAFFSHPRFREWAVRWLQEREVAFWIIDPFARAFSSSENDNALVGRFLDDVDVIKHEAGVSDLLLVTHTGRKIHEEGEEHARGATRLDDWADQRWILTKMQDDRFLKAHGREVDQVERRLEFDPHTLHLSIVIGEEPSDRKATRERSALTDAMERIEEILADTRTMSVGDLEKAVGGRRKTFLEARKALVGEGLIRESKKGTTVFVSIVEPEEDVGASL